MINRHETPLQPDLARPHECSHFLGVKATAALKGDREARIDELAVSDVLELISAVRSSYAEKLNNEGIDPLSDPKSLGNLTALEMAQRFVMPSRDEYGQSANQKVSLQRIMVDMKRAFDQFMLSQKEILDDISLGQPQDAVKIDYDEKASRDESRSHLIGINGLFQTARALQIMQFVTDIMEGGREFDESVEKVFLELLDQEVTVDIAGISNGQTGPILLHDKQPNIETETQ